jgi:hypothetical protein
MRKRSQPKARIFGDVDGVPRGEELAFFHVHGAAGFGGGFEHVRLAAEEGGDLQEIDVLGGDVRLFGGVDVGGDGDVEFLAISPRMRQPSLMPGPRKESTDVRLALSKEALKRKWMPVRSAISLSERAISQAKASDSRAQGPRMKNGTGPPTGTLPMLKGSKDMFWVEAEKLKLGSIGSGLRRIDRAVSGSGGRWRAVSIRNL